MKERMYLTIKDMNKEERPREKIVNMGVNSLSNAELLAVIIRTGTKEASALDLAQRILAIDEKGIGYLQNCTIEELSKIKGIGKTKACQILSSIELGKRLARSVNKRNINIKSPKDIASMYMEEMRCYNKEYFKTILLNTKNKIISTELISIGTLNSSLVHPREVFVQAIRRSASSMILLHNHPSGDVSPSKEDINITKRLIEVSHIVGIEILDHIIIGDGSYYSFKESFII
ncbi:hypothetical protein CCE28_02810 [Anaeromicrobium sediminis]|uniref:MPN domain-containing protein n=2 Tax=Anaeromicrobium sediminis TaxID=1478221 RepID=A0A267MPJ9_9FIRM|nr:hypothetical protein CCE28_02810 [Anaeromicrobium sediminis]